MTTTTIAHLTEDNKGHYDVYESHMFPSNELYQAPIKKAKIQSIRFEHRTVIIECIFEGRTNKEIIYMNLDIAHRTRLVDNRIIDYTFKSREEYLNPRPYDFQ